MDLFSRRKRRIGQSWSREDPDAFLAFADLVLEHSFAQRLQDVWALWETGFRTAGYFVEFGALSGRDFSNTYTLEQLGWQGIVAEPHPDYERPLRRNRKCHISTRCVFDESGKTVTFHAVRGRPALSGINGFGEGDDKQDLRSDFVSYPVETVSLLDLLLDAGAPPQIDFLSIDTEGSEPVILRAFDFHKYAIQCITVEHNVHQRQELYALLASKGYRRKWPEISGHDDWYVHDGAYPRWSSSGASKLVAKLAASPVFEQALHERRHLLDQLTKNR